MNGKDSIDSTTVSTAVLISGLADKPGLLATAVTTTTEDVAVNTAYTPYLIQDTDNADRLRKMSVFGVVPHGMSKVSFFSANDDTVALKEDSVYTLTSLAEAGFESGLRINALSVLGAADCDVDFTLSTIVTSVESNNKDTSNSDISTVGVKLAAAPDVPAILLTHVAQALEDTPTQVDLTPVVGDDTDFSDALRKVFANGFLPDGSASAANKFSFAGLDECTSSV
eukprot:Rmarinus@m.15012